MGLDASRGDCGGGVGGVDRGPLMSDGVLESILAELEQVKRELEERFRAAGDRELDLSEQLEQVKKERDEARMEWPAGIRHFRQLAFKAEAERDELRAKVVAYKAHRDKLRAERDRLAESLRWYVAQHDAADRDQCVCSPCNKARAALASMEGGA